MDFELVMSQRIWEERLRQSIVVAIAEHEKRIEKLDISIKISEVEKRHAFEKYLAIRRKVDVFINATICETGESYHFHTDLFLSPISQY